MNTNDTTPTPTHESWLADRGIDPETFHKQYSQPAREAFWKQYLDSLRADELAEAVTMSTDGAKAYIKFKQAEVDATEADEYAEAWADIVSGRDMHNTCQGCGTDAHSAVYCPRCREEVDGQPVAILPIRDWFDRIAAYPFTHEKQVTRAFGWIIGVLVVLGIVAQVGMARGWWGR